jgi:hypothetical protein
VGCYFGCQGFDYLLGCVEVSVAQDAEQTFVTKLTQFGVFGLVQSVGIDEEWASLDGIDLFAYILQIGP